jgi:hypothetical protein
MQCDRCLKDRREFKIINHDIAICYKCYDDWVDEGVTEILENEEELGLFRDRDCKKCDEGYIYSYGSDTGHTAELCDCIIFGTKLEEVVKGERCIECGDLHDNMVYQDSNDNYICDDCYGIEQDNPFRDWVNNFLVKGK